MSLADRLYEKARYYELLAASCAERAPLDPDDLDGLRLCAVNWTVVAIVLREMGAILDGEEGGW